MAGSGFAKNDVGFDGAGRVGDERFAERDREWRLLAHRFYVSARAMPDKTIIGAAHGGNSQSQVALSGLVLI